MNPDILRRACEVAGLVEAFTPASRTRTWALHDKHDVCTAPHAVEEAREGK